MSSILDAPLFDLIEDDDALDPLRFPMIIGGEGIDPETLRQDIGPHEHLVRLGATVVREQLDSS